MFDIGFSEIFVIALVALIVIGPERLPKVARTLGHLFGRMQRYVNDVKADITREMELDELRKLQASVEDAARAIEQSVNKEISTTESELNRIATVAADGAAAPPAVETPPASSTTEPATATAPATGAVPPNAVSSTPQLELGLGLDTADDATRKQA